MNFSTGIQVFFLSIIAMALETLVCLSVVSGVGLAVSSATDTSPAAESDIRTTAGTVVFAYQVVALHTLAVGVAALIAGIIETATRRPDRGMHCLLFMMVVLVVVDLAVILFQSEAGGGSYSARLAPTISQEGR